MVQEVGEQPGVPAPHRWTVRGDAAGLRPVAAAVTAVAVERGAPASDAARLELAVHELLVNAVEHGNGGDPALPVDIEVAGSAPEPVRIRVGDTGAGGVWTPPAPGELPPVTVGRGRGLTLVRCAVEALGVRCGPHRTEVTISVRTGPHDTCG